MKVLAILLLSFFIGLLFLANSYSLFALVGFFLYLWLLFKYPEIALFITILVVNDFFSLVSADFLRIPGVFRIKDIFLVMAFIPLAHKVYHKKIKFQLNNLSKSILLIMFFVVLEALITIIIRNQSFNYTIRMARRYLYFLLYFPMIYLIDDERKFKRFLSLLIISSAAFSLLMIIQYVIGPTKVIFKYASHVVMQQIVGEYVTRSYVLGSSLAIMIFFLYLFRLFFKVGNKAINLTMVFLTFLGGVYLGFSRANLFGVIAGLGFATFILLDFRWKIRIIATSFIFIFVLFFLLEGVKFYSENTISNPLYITYKSLVSGASDLANRTGTFGYRLKDSAARIALIKANPFLGVGFIHPLSGILKIRTLTPGITTNDSGIVTLLLDFGVTGIIWLGFLSIVFFKEAKRLCNILRENSTKVLVIAAFAFYFSRLFSFLTLADFVSYHGIVSICIALFIVTQVGKGICIDGFIGNNR